MLFLPWYTFIVLKAKFFLCIQRNEESKKKSSYEKIYVDSCLPHRLRDKDSVYVSAPARFDGGRRAPQH